MHRFRRWWVLPVDHEVLALLICNVASPWYRLKAILVLEGRAVLCLLLHLMVLLVNLILIWLVPVRKFLALLNHASVVRPDYSAASDNNSNSLDQFGLGALLHKGLILCYGSLQRVGRRDVEPWRSVLVDLPRTVPEICVLVEVLRVCQVVNVHKGLLELEQLVKRG